MNSPMDDALGGYNWQKSIRSDIAKHFDFETKHEKTLREQMDERYLPQVDKKAELINDILKQNIADMEALHKMGLDPVVVAHGMIMLQMDAANKIRNLLHGKFTEGGIVIGNPKDSHFPENVETTPPTYKNFEKFGDYVYGKVASRNYSVIGDMDKFHNIVSVKCAPVDEISLAERLREALKHSDGK
jgi:hypothetical protein